MENSMSTWGSNMDHRGEKCGTRAVSIRDQGGGHHLNSHSSTCNKAASSSIIRPGRLPASRWVCVLQQASIETNCPAPGFALSYLIV